MATPTFNKYKSTTIYGNLSVRDLTNSSGSSVVEVASVDLSGNFISRGDSTFTKAVVCNALLADINANNKLTTKEYVDSVAGVGGDVSLAGTNAFTGTNSFNTNLPTSTQTPTTFTQLTTKTYVDGGISTAITGLSSVYSTLTNQVKTNVANTFTSTNTFNEIKLFDVPLNIPVITIDGAGISVDPAYSIGFYGQTLFSKSITQPTDGNIDQDRTLPSGLENNFIDTLFLRGS